jgi:apolipoprotein N-acyltransferase
VVVIQPNIPQDVKLTMAGDPKRADEIFLKHRSMTTRVFADGQKRDLVIWPESVIYGGLFFETTHREWGGPMARDMMSLSVEIGTPILFGSEIMSNDPAAPRDVERFSFTNSAALVDGARGVVYRYDKVHLVLFSEKIPEWVPFLEYFTKKYTGVSRLMSFTEGTKFTTFELGGTRFGTAICFEAVFPEIARDYARNGARALVNISNEGWFRGSAELDQMLVMNRFRAIESRLAVVRATNTGISAVILPNGRTAAIVPGKEVDGTIDEKVRTWKGGCLYRVVGDLLGWLAGAAVAAALVWIGATRMLTARQGESIVAR